MLLFARVALLALATLLSLLSLGVRAHAEAVTDPQQLKALAPSAYFFETFDTPDVLETRWFHSEATKETASGTRDQFDGKWVVAEPTVVASNVSTKGLTLTSPARHHAIVAKLETPIDFRDSERDFVLQYEVKNQETIQCGGSYIKLLTYQEGFEPRQFHDKTPYTIMFGPDKCGQEDKVHFIFRHTNPLTGEITEKHQSKLKFSALIDKHTTILYRLVVHPDNTFSISINGASRVNGSLLQDFTPPVNPPETIDDPEDHKPADWVDIEKIPDPEARKPDDWDEDQPMYIETPDAVQPEDWLEDEPLMIPDPKAHKPADWSDEDDGEYVAPQVANPKCEKASGCGKWTPPMMKNPEYKGKWRAPMIDNPAYKGPFKPRQLPNPDYYYDAHPFRFSTIGAVGFELWTMQAGIVFDNILITPSLEEADRIADATWKVKYAAEGELLTAQENNKSNSVLATFFNAVVEQFNGFIKLVTQDPIEAAKKFPAIAGAFVAVPVIFMTIIMLALPSSTPQQLPARPAAPRQEQQAAEGEQSAHGQETQAAAEHDGAGVGADASKH